MTELGSGYEIARRDLDIRGGGEAGGTQQHGSRNGSYSLFYRLLEQELNRLRGIGLPVQTEVNTDRGSGFIPEHYIPQEDVRITLYRRLMNTRSPDELEALTEEMRDRFGPLPEDVSYLVGLLGVKNFGDRFGIVSVDVRKGLAVVKYKGGEIPAVMKQYVRSLGRNVKYVTV